MEKSLESVMEHSPGQKENPNKSMPNEERRRILKKLAACAVAAPAAMVLLDGGDNLTYAGLSSEEKKRFINV